MCSDNSSVVYLILKTARQTLDHCLAIVESKSPRPQIPLPLSFPGRLLALLYGFVKNLDASRIVRQVFRPPDETEVADATTVYRTEIVAKAIARGTSACTKRSIQFTAVKRVRLDADKGADDVKSLFNDCGVLVDRVEKLHSLHCAAVEAAEASQRRNV